MRCLNLVEPESENVREVVMIGEVAIPFAAKRLRRLGVTVCSLPEKVESDVLVVDTYDPNARRMWSSAGDFRLRVLVDDLGGRVPTGFDVVWNPNAYGHRGLYPDFTGVLLTGADSIAIRSDLTRWTGGVAGRVGVAPGGGKILPVLAESFRRVAAFFADHEFAASGDWVPAGWRVIDSQRPWTELTRCERIIVTGGIMTWEAAVVGIPVVVLKTANNQHLVIRWAADHGIPTIDASSTQSPKKLALAVATALPLARPLPGLASGSASVVRRLCSMLKER
jgi:hypothetical protein